MASQKRPAAIQLRELSKIYHLDSSRIDRLRRLVGRSSRGLQVHALDRVDLEVAAGEALGVIGENGAGKSTLMKVVAGTTRPSSGHVQVVGTVASILELGAGFHPEFTGRDNAVLYGALMGIPRSEMIGRLDEILAFSELGEFIDHPIKGYSTGMAMRLAFAVATHVNPAILVIDEALAVGDGYFQKKCINRILEVKGRGTTILFCSHAMYFVTQFCDRALWLDHGRVRRLGATKEVVDSYEAHLLQRERRRLGDEHAPPLGTDSTLGARVGRIRNVRVVSDRDEVVSELAPAPPMTLEIETESIRAEERYHVAMAIDTLDGHCVLGLSTAWDGEQPLQGQTSYRVELEIPELPVAQGTFNLSVFLLDETALHVHDQVMLCEAFTVTSQRWTPSLLELPHCWRRQ